MCVDLLLLGIIPSSTHSYLSVGAYVFVNVITDVAKIVSNVIDVDVCALQWY